jgi:hypothetical protein
MRCQITIYKFENYHYYPFGLTMQGNKAIVSCPNRGEVRLQLLVTGTTRQVKLERAIKEATKPKN